MLRIYRQITAVILAAAVLFFFPVCALAKAPDTSASAAAVISQQTGEILFEKNSHVRRSMASTTKIMTAYLALLYGEPDKTVLITEKMTAEGTSAGLKAGDRMTLRNLVYAMLLQSGNDAANAAACAVAGSVERFSRMMNRCAADIGMKDTRFVTPSGLDAQGHYTTAYDMALLTRRALSLPAFEEICSLKNGKIDFVKPEKSVSLTNHNKLLYTLDGAFGVKTGFTKKSGRCLVSAVRRNGNSIIIVTLNDPDDWRDHAALADYCFSLLKKKKAEITLPQLCITGGSVDRVPLITVGDTSFSEHENGKITYRINVRRFEYAPVNAGDIVGTVDIFRNGEKFMTVSLAAAGSSERKTISKGNRLSNFIKGLFS